MINWNERPNNADEIKEVFYLVEEMIAKRRFADINKFLDEALSQPIETIDLAYLRLLLIVVQPVRLHPDTLDNITLLEIAIDNKLELLD